MLKHIAIYFAISEILKQFSSYGIPLTFQWLHVDLTVGKDVNIFVKYLVIEIDSTRTTPRLLSKPDSVREGGREGGREREREREKERELDTSSQKRNSLYLSSWRGYSTPWS